MKIVHYDGAGNQFNDARHGAPARVELHMFQTGTLRTKLKYIKIPLLFTFNSNEDRKASFLFEAGPQLSLLTAASSNNSTSNTSYENSDSYSKTNFGIVVAPKVRFRLSEVIYLLIGPRMDYDFTNASVNNTYTQTNNVSLNQVLLYNLFEYKVKVGVHELQAAINCT